MVPFLSLTKFYVKVITQLKFSSLWIITVFWICSEHMLRKDSPSFFFFFDVFGRDLSKLLQDMWLQK